MKAYKTKKQLKDRKKKKLREAERAKAESEVESVPRSIIYLKGKHGKAFANLKRDFVSTMLPYTAVNFEVRKKDTSKELVKFAIETTVTHLIEFSQTEKGSRLRIGRLPKGPTLYFNIEEFTLTKDLRNFGTSERDLKFSSIDTIAPAVVILNQFNQDKDHIKLVGTTLQNMFPAVNLKKFDYKNAKRVVLFDYNPETDLIDMRQFKIKTDSNDVKVNINLVETGPRMTLKLVKIVDEAFSGETIYHSFISKTPHEIEASKKKRQQFESAKEARRKIQKENVEKKERAKEEKKMKETEKVSKIRKEGHEKMKKYLNSNVEEEEDDDEEYYRQEVGENPPEELELKKRKISNPDESKRKKFKK